MFKIYDGRQSFYQWDIDRKLIIDDAEISEVHFCNRTDDCSLVVATYEQDGLTLVNVPNILLQQDWRINVYAYDKNYTKHSEQFNVIKRSKPDSYVYTETEILNYNSLLERIEETENNIGQAVVDYLEKNPIEVDLSNYYEKEETDNKFALKEEVPTITGLATEEYVDEKVGSIEIPEVDFTGIATEKYVDDAVAAIELLPGPAGKDGENGKDYVLTEDDKAEIAGMVPGADVDLSDYYTKEEIDGLLSNLPVGDIPSGEEVGF